tara:strand:- start:3932 stop:5692 length:1761 start_codon:yes stop_codon:yes gene_type:complete
MAAAQVLQALNMILDDRSRREQRDVQSSLGAMELALKEKKMEEDAIHRRFSRKKALVETEDALKTSKAKRGQIAQSIRTSRTVEEKNRQDIFLKAWEGMNESYEESQMMLANQIWSDFGFSALWTYMEVGEGKPVTVSNMTRLRTHLEKNGMDKASAQFITKKVAQIGAQEKKPASTVIGLGRFVRNRLVSIQNLKGNEKNQKLKDFVDAGYNVGIFTDPFNSEYSNKQEMVEKNMGLMNDIGKLNKIAVLDDIKAKLTQERYEMSYQDDDSSTTSDEELGIRYEFQNDNRNKINNSLRGFGEQLTQEEKDQNKKVYTKREIEEAQNKYWSQIRAGSQWVDNFRNLKSEAQDELRASGDLGYAQSVEGVLGPTGTNITSLPNLQLTLPTNMVGKTPNEIENYWENMRGGVDAELFKVQTAIQNHNAETSAIATNLANMRQSGISVTNAEELTRQDEKRNIDLYRLQEQQRALENWMSNLNKTMSAIPVDESHGLSSLPYKDINQDQKQQRYDELALRQMNPIGNVLMDWFGGTSEEQRFDKVNTSNDEKYVDPMGDGLDPIKKKKTDDLKLNTMKWNMIFRGLGGY